MFSRKIVKRAGDLKKPCEDASLDEGFNIIDQLEISLAIERGIGLAANQIGINKRVFIVRVPIEQGGEEVVIGHNFINPVITHRSNPVVFENEGCLSFPGNFIKTIRYNNVTIKDLLSPEGRDFEGLEAVCVQHETDHTLGKIMYESAVPMFKDSTPCPCESGKVFADCCKIELIEKNFLND